MDVRIAEGKREDKGDKNGLAKVEHGLAAAFGLGISAEILELRAGEGGFLSQREFEVRSQPDAEEVRAKMPAAGNLALDNRGAARGRAVDHGARPLGCGRAAGRGQILAAAEGGHRKSVGDLADIRAQRGVVLDIQLAVTENSLQA